MATVQRVPGVSEVEDGGPIASIVIPAHNEASVIGRLLEALPKKIGTRDVQIIVACNGCTDATADLARSYGVTVVELETPSKIVALNAGDAVAKAFPRLYIDADIEITARAVADLVRTLSAPGALCAAPVSRMELAGRPWLIRAYFSFWRQLMQMREGYVGGGVYAFSSEGRTRFGQFPDVIADDTFVRNLFSRAERQTVTTDATVVQAPRTFRALLRRRVRVCIGNLELASLAAQMPTPGSLESRLSWRKVALAHPALIPASLVYVSVNAAARLAAARQIRRNGPIGWGRDNTTRSVST